MQKLKLGLLATSLLLLGVSCKKQDFTEQPKAELKIDQSKVFKLPTTPQEKLLVENLGKVTGIFKELYKDNSNLKLVNAAVFSKAFTDESVLLKDLIYPDNSWLNKISKFKTLTTKWNVSLIEFSNNFWTEVRKLNDPAFNQFLDDLEGITSNIGGNGNGEGVSVYFPYSDEFLPEEGGSYAPITSVATATADADEGWGQLPYYLNGIFQNYVQVLVNDDFVFANPTHIIGVNGIEQEPEPTEPPPPPPPPPGVSRIYIGEGICLNQYDRLISFTGNGGGSEIKYCHMTGYLQPVNGQVTSFQDITSVDFSRKDIRKEKWRNTYSVWDDDWVPADTEQFLGIYEEDNTNTKTFSGSISTTATLTATPVVVTGTASLGFSISIQSQDDIIKQLKISRNSYFAGAFQNQGKGFSDDATFLPLPFTHGWPAYDVHYQDKTGANVGWTWPYNTF